LCTLIITGVLQTDPGLVSRRPRLFKRAAFLFLESKKPSPGLTG
jgi:hypothetical protein